jgi:hypothetical protein
VKRDFLSLQIRDHFLGSINRSFIVDSEQYPAISLDRLVDIETLRAHCYGPLQAQAKSRLLCYDDGDSVLFQREFRRLRFGSARLRTADEVALVQRMFRSFTIDQKNEVQIARELNEEGRVNQYPLHLRAPD